jgi:hypothetical protein
MKVEHLVASGFEAAFRGMRNPLDSWNKSDSTFDKEDFIIGQKDLELAQRLISAGPEHCKFLRQINVSFDLTLPLYTWKEFDTYQVGVTKNSCSTMHTIHKKEFSVDDFQHDHLLSTMGSSYEAIDWLEKTVELLNHYRLLYLAHKEKIYWYQLIQMLPSSYLQKRTVTMNYAVLRNIVKQRKNHKLDEWKQFINAIKELPYAEELIFYGLDNEEEK